MRRLISILLRWLRRTPAAPDPAQQYAEDMRRFIEIEKAIGSSDQRSAAFCIACFKSGQTPEQALSAWRKLELARVTAELQKSQMILTIINGPAVGFRAAGSNGNGHSAKFTGGAVNRDRGL
jgi:hypothetical protein